MGTKIILSFLLFSLSFSVTVHGQYQKGKGEATVSRNKPHAYTKFEYDTFQNPVANKEGTITINVIHEGGKVSVKTQYDPNDNSFWKPGCPETIFNGDITAPASFQYKVEGDVKYDKSNDGGNGKTKKDWDWDVDISYRVVNGCGYIQTNPMEMSLYPCLKRTDCRIWVPFFTITINPLLITNPATLLNEIPGYFDFLNNDRDYVSGEFCYPGITPARQGVSAGPAGKQCPKCKKNELDYATAGYRPEANGLFLIALPNWPMVNYAGPLTAATWNSYFQKVKQHEENHLDDFMNIVVGKLNKIDQKMYFCQGLDNDAFLEAYNYMASELMMASYLEINNAFDEYDKAAEEREKNDPTDPRNFFIFPLNW